MSSVWITGDTHGDVRRLSNTCFPEQKEMDKQEENYLIVLGDFGVVWDYKGENATEKYWLDWLESKNFTTLFIDGNHDCFDRLYLYPVSEWHGGKVHFIRPNVIHLMRGQIFDICGKKFFTFGGASSHDISDGILELDDPRVHKWKYDMTKMFRINHVSWWVEELPTDEEMEEGLNNLGKESYKVDYILTHCCYTSLLSQLDGGSGLYKNDILSDYLQVIKQLTEYKQWLFGHFHINKNIYFERASCLYEQIVRIL